MNPAPPTCIPCRKEEEKSSLSSIFLRDECVRNIDKNWSKDFVTPEIAKNLELRTSRAFANFTSGKFTFRRFQQGIYVWGAGFVFPVRNSSEYSLVHVHIGVTSYRRYGSEKIDKHVPFNVLRIMVP